MGVDFYCGDYTFHCSYSGWNNIRRQIIKSCFDYISDKFAKDQINWIESNVKPYNMITHHANVEEDDKECIGENSQYYRHMNDVKQIIARIEKESETKTKITPPTDGATNVWNFIKACNNEDDVGVLARACNTNFDWLDALTYFEINGLHTLCNKRDCEGYYSPGNSIDICHLLDLIKPFVKVNDEYIYGRIYEDNYKLDSQSPNSFTIYNLYGLFTESATKRLIITIC